MQRVVSYPILILFLVLISACTRSDTSINTITDTSWELTHIRSTKSGKKTRFPKGAQNITLQFKSKSDTLSFSGVCNHGSGTYAIDDKSDKIEISAIGTTGIHCPYIEWEIYVVTNLRKAHNYKLAGNNLTIYSDGDYDLIFKRVD